MNAVEVHELTRNFGNFVAVNRISFSVAPGEIFGFLGANGAGKTTTIRMLCGIIAPTSGRATVLGYNLEHDTFKLKLQIGYMSQKFSLYDELTVKENLEFFGGIYHLPHSQLRKRIRQILDLTELGGKENTLTANLPPGWKQRLALGCAIIHEPKILFLDEPTAGVDPKSRRYLWDLLYQLVQKGVTVILTTHYLDEAEHCHRLLLMENGKIIAQGSPPELKTQVLKGNLYEVSAEPFDRVFSILNSLHPYYLEPFGMNFHILPSSQSNFPEQAQKQLENGRCRVAFIRPIEAGLEDVFLALSGRKENYPEEKIHP